MIALNWVGFPDGSVVKNPLANTGEVGLIPGSGRSPREGNGNPLQYSGPGNFMDRGALRVTVHAVVRVRHDLVTEQQQQYSTMNSIDKRTMYTRDTQLLLLV